MNPFWTVSLFWLATVVCVGVALAFVLPALLRARAGAATAARRDVNIAVFRDQLKELEADRASGLLSEAQFEAAKLELESRMVDDALAGDAVAAPARTGGRRLGYALAGVLPAAAFGLYFWLGNPASLIAIAEAQNAPAPMAAAAGGGHDIMQMIQQVEEKTRANPDDGAAWAMLAKTYAAVEHWPEALQAYEKAIKLLPEEASVMSGYAEALAISNNRVLAGRPIELVQQALAKDPDDMKALELAGISAYQENNFAQAAVFFKRLHKLLPPESPYAQDVLAAQREAEQMVQRATTGLDTLAEAPTAAPPAAPPAAAFIEGRLELAPALKSRLGANDTVFLFARAEQGGPPVAAIRTEASKLPLDFRLDDSMAMNPGNALSRQKQVALVARVSKTGEVVARPGDLEGRVVPVKVGATGVKLVIDQVLP
jgi:cytochrome c-type biogenesis protein CcmH